MFKIEFYKKEDGTAPAREFVQGLPSKMRAKALSVLDYIEEHGTTAREPFSKYIGDGIFEARISSGGSAARVLYFFYVGEKIVLTNGFVKKTQKTPKKEIKKAIAYKADYEKRSGR